MSKKRIVSFASAKGTLDSSPSDTISTVADASSVINDFSELITIADALKEKCEQQESKLFFLRLLAMGLSAFGVRFYLWLAEIKLFDFSTYTFSNNLALDHLIVFICMSIVVFFILYFLRQEMLRINDSKKADERALYKIVEILRETQSIVDSSNTISSFQQAKISILLSRFKIAAEEKRVFWN